MTSVLKFGKHFGGDSIKKAVGRDNRERVRIGTDGHMNSPERTKVTLPAVTFLEAPDPLRNCEGIQEVDKLYGAS